MPAMAPLTATKFLLLSFLIAVNKYLKRSAPQGIYFGWWFEVIKSIIVEKMPLSRWLFRSRRLAVACPMEQEVEGKRLAQVIKLKAYPSDSSFK